MEEFDSVPEGPKNHEIKLKGSYLPRFTLEVYQNGKRVNKADYVFNFKDILQYMGVTLSIDKLESDSNTADLVKVVKSDIKTGQNGIS